MQIVVSASLARTLQRGMSEEAWEETEPLLLIDEPIPAAPEPEDS